MLMSNPPPNPWCRLFRSGGSETDPRIPSEHPLVDSVTFFGRFPALDPLARVDASVNPSLYSNNKWREYHTTSAADSTKNIRLFSHESQLVIPCLFVSATHFAIRVEYGRGGEGAGGGDKSSSKSPGGKEQSKYYLKDYSRNGTYVNAVLVGQDKEVELFNGDEISVKFKAEDKIIYKFKPEVNVRSSSSVGGGEYQIKSSPAAASSAASAAASSSFSSSSKQSLDNGSNALLQIVQITSLKEENSALEFKVNQAYDQIDELRRENANFASEIKVKIGEIAANNAKIEEFRQNIQDYEFNKSADSARILNLEATNDDLNKEISELRIKNNRLQEDIQRKTVAQQKRDDIINDLNIESANKDRIILELEDALRISRSDCAEFERKEDSYSRTISLLQESICKYDTKNSTLLELNNSMNEKIHQLNGRLTARLLGVSEMSASVNRLLEEYRHQEEAENILTEVHISDLSNICCTSKDMLSIKDNTLMAIENRKPSSLLPSSGGDDVDLRMATASGGQTQLCFDEDSRQHQPTQEQSASHSGYSPQLANSYNRNSQSNSNTPNSKKSRSNNPSSCASPSSRSSTDSPEAAYSSKSSPLKIFMQGSYSDTHNNDNDDGVMQRFEVVTTLTEVACISADEHSSTGVARDHKENSCNAHVLAPDSEVVSDRKSVSQDQYEPQTTGLGKRKSLDRRSQ